MNQYKATKGGSSGAITSSALTMSTNRLLGRTTTGTGAVEEISVTGNNGLLFTGGALSIDRALQTDMETPTTGNKMVASTVMVYHPGVAKAHCRFGPTGATSGPTYNVASITDLGTGNWTINLNGLLPPSSSNNTIVLTVEHSAPLIAVVHNRGGVTSYEIRCYDLSGTLTDPTFINFALFGDL